MHKHHLSGASLICLQAVLNLKSLGTDGTFNPTVLTGEAMNQDELLAEFEEKNLPEFVRKIYFYWLWIAYLFRRYDTASEMATLYQEMGTENPINPSHEVISGTL